jgi:hypothetical protein
MEFAVQISAVVPSIHRGGGRGVAKPPSAEQAKSDGVEEDSSRADAASMGGGRHGREVAGRRLASANRIVDGKGHSRSQVLEKVRRAPPEAL